MSFSEIMDFAHHTSLAIASRDGAGLLEEFDSDNDGSLSLEEHLKAYDSDAEDPTRPILVTFLGQLDLDGSLLPDSLRLLEWGHSNL